jgi:SAM-dependent methyltransferase
MDRWKFFDITHRYHVVCNPISIEKLEELVALLRLRPGARVLDIASGKAEFLVRLAERYEIEGVGVDLSPHFIADARRKHQQRVPEAHLRFLEMEGADYAPEELESFDVVACIGASWIYGGHKETLRALAGMAAGVSWIVVGEPYWRQQPAEEYVAAIGQQRSTHGTHKENAEVGQAQGLELAYTLVSSPDDWDRYEGLQWYAAEQWALAHPEDPDVEAVLEQVRGNKIAYLTWGRDTMGWAIYVFMKGAYGPKPAC